MWFPCRKCANSSVSQCEQTGNPLTAGKFGVVSVILVVLKTTLLQHNVRFGLFPLHICYGGGNTYFYLKCKSEADAFRTETRPSKMLYDSVICDGSLACCSRASLSAEM